MLPVPVEWILLNLALASAPDLDDPELAGRIRGGDRKAFRIFFDRHHRGLYGLLVRRGVEPQVAEDIIQQAFLIIWEHRERIDPARSLRAYLFQIGYNRALNHFRDTRKFDYGDPLPEQIEPDDPAGTTERNELRRQIDSAVAVLPEKRRQVFELCFLTGLTYREAAEVMGVSPKTVENHMALALKDLRSTLEHLNTNR